RVRTDLALVNGGAPVRVQELDLVFEGDDVIVILAIDAINDRGKRRGFTCACGAGDEHEAVAQTGDLAEVRRQIQQVERRHFGRDDAHDDGVRTALLKDIDAEAYVRRERIAEIGRACVREPRGGVRVPFEQSHRNDLCLVRGQLL